MLQIPVYFLGFFLGYVGIPASVVVGVIALLAILGSVFNTPNEHTTFVNDDGTYAIKLQDCDMLFVRTGEENGDVRIVWANRETGTCRSFQDNYLGWKPATVLSEIRSGMEWTVVIDGVSHQLSRALTQRNTLRSRSWMFATEEFPINLTGWEDLYANPSPNMVGLYDTRRGGLFTVDRNTDGSCRYTHLSVNQRLKRINIAKVYKSEACDQADNWKYLGDISYESGLITGRWLGELDGLTLRRRIVRAD